MILTITVEFNDGDGLHMEENLNKAIDNLSKTLKEKGMREMELTGVNMELQEMYKVTIKNNQQQTPIGFKGTKGALLKPQYNKAIVEIDNGKDTFWFAETYAHGVGKPEIRYANAKLISQSKELAKALRDIVNWKELGDIHTTETDSRFDLGIRQTDQLKKVIANAKQVLKDAGL